jgi:hypothetical protein
MQIIHAAELTVGASCHWAGSAWKFCSRGKAESVFNNPKSRID